MNLYADYTTLFTKSAETMEKCKKVSAFRQYKKKWEKEYLWDDPITGNTVESFLILPIQRLPRYVLLLREARKHTDANSPDMPLLVRALELLESAAAAVNEKQRSNESEKKRLQDLEELNKRLQGAIKDLVTPSRWFICEGGVVLYNISKEKAIDHRYFLFNDTLILCTAKHKKYKLRHSIPLHKARIKDLSDGQNVFGHRMKNAFELHTPLESFLLWTVTPQEKQVLQDELQKAISECSGGRNLLVEKNPKEHKRAHSSN